MTQLPSRKRRKLSVPGISGPETPVAISKSGLSDNYVANASRWNLEQSYETKPRKNKRKEKENTRLPIKTAEGRIEALDVPLGDDEQASDSSWESEDGDGVIEQPASLSAPSIPENLQIIDAKEELAQIASLINVDPEEHIGGLKRLAELSKSPIITIRKLALATEAAVYKDIIPGYRIRQLTDVDLGEKISKEVRKQRAFEQGIVGGYQAYVRELAKCAKEGRRATSESVASLAKVAISCACILILAVPHFNFRGELLQILIDKLSQRRMDDDVRKCVSTLEKLFQEDEDGNASREAVGMLTTMIKKRDYHIDECVLNTFLHLRLLTEFSSKGSHDSIDQHPNGAPIRLGGKKIKEKREFRTKKQRKTLKELKAVEKEFREADAGVRYEERERMQAETLKLVFGTYFRILKARSPRLTGAVLEGLAKFTHLINQDFFGDLLVTLQELATQALASIEAAAAAEDENEEDGKGTRERVIEQQASSRPNNNPYRTALLCTATAFSLLSAQDASSLELDLSFFTRLLFDLLLPLGMEPDLELSARSYRLADPHAVPSHNDDHHQTPTPAATKVNATKLSTLLMRGLAGALTPRSTPPLRLAAFFHRLMTFALHVPEKTGQATLMLLQELSRKQGRKVRQLWNTEERRGDGTFDPLAGMEACRPYCGTLWEGELLRKHYAVGVSSGLGELESLVKDLA